MDQEELQMALDKWAAEYGPDEFTVWGDNEDSYRVQLAGVDDRWRYIHLDDYDGGFKTVLPPEFARDGMSPKECMAAFSRLIEVTEPYEHRGYKRGRKDGREEIRLALAGLIGPDAISTVLSNGED